MSEEIRARNLVEDATRRNSRRRRPAKVVKMNDALDRMIEYLKVSLQKVEAEIQAMEELDRRATWLSTESAIGRGPAPAPDLRIWAGVRKRAEDEQKCEKILP